MWKQRAESQPQHKNCSTRCKQGEEMGHTTFKKIFLFVAMAIILNFVAGEASAQKKIGILMFSEQPRYYESINGMRDQLKKEGFGEPAVTFTIENAKSSKAKVVEIVRKFAAAKMDLIITIGTSATVPTAQAIKDVPILFNMVYDPIQAGIAKDWKSSGNNTTGVSTRVPMSKLLSSLIELKPIKRLAVLYTPGEKNSEVELLELLKNQEKFQIKAVPIILAKKEEATQALSEVVRTVDALYLTGSSVVSAAVPIIASIANKATVLTMTHLDDLVDKGVLLGVCPDAYQLGRLAGKKAARILKGDKPSSIPIETGKKFDVVLNMKTAEAGQFQIPPKFMKTVTRTIE
jgi:putative tryptophan/tyrosine transport system substrate-binding protein